MQSIQSKENPRFKHWAKLARSVREQRQAGLLMIEGLHLLQAWKDSGRVLSEPNNVVLVSDTGLARPEIAHWIDQQQVVECIHVSDRLFAQLAEADTPSGILAWVDYPLTAQQPDLALDSVLLDGVQDPGNLGTLLRTAAAAGVQQVLLSAGCCSAWSGKSLRSGQGAQFALNVFERFALTDFLSCFQGMSIATSLEDALPLFGESAFSCEEPLAWVFGAEGTGISKPVLDSVQRRLTIPMPGNVESLNVSAAAAVCLFEMLRRRAESKSPSQGIKDIQ